MAADAWMIPAAHRGGREHLDRAIDAAGGRACNVSAGRHRRHPLLYPRHRDERRRRAKALPYAEKLEALAPAASHLVHMPSHTYFWAGRYRLAEQSNLDAVEIDRGDAARLKPKDGVFGLELSRATTSSYGEGGGA